MPLNMEGENSPVISVHIWTEKKLFEKEFEFR